MKQIFSSILILALVLSLAACGSKAANNGEAQSAPAETANPEPAQTPTPEASPADESAAPADSESDGGKILVAYFSWSGNTETLAGMIQESTGGDLFAIAPETPYTDDYNELLDVAQSEQRDNARPALAAQVENWDEYDTIFVGYPNWWGDTPMLILSFLESYDCTGKTIVPFATSGGGGFGRGLDSIAVSAPGAEILEGFHVSGSSVDNAAGDVTAWIDGLGL